MNVISGMNGFYLFLFAARLSLVVSYDDLSYNKYATQSTTYTGPYNAGKAGNAVDRNITTCTRTKAIGATSPYQRVTWQVDLGQVYSIHSINIVFRNYIGHEMRQRGRFAGFTLYVSATEVMQEASVCYRDQTELPPLNFTTTCFTFGRYIIFYNERLANVTYPDQYENPVYTELCEFTVLGCNNSGVYGSNCDFPCPTTCRENLCHTQNGTCFSCKPGIFGSKCDMPCPTNCAGDACDMLEGTCSPCKPGWTGSSCNAKCMAGWYGQECKSRCLGQCQQNATCNHRTGWCDVGCAYGWTGLFCNIEKIDLSRHKYASQLHTAIGAMSDARYAVDRNITTCTKTEVIGVNGTNTEVWWSVDLGKVYAIYSVYIQFRNYDGLEMRQRGRFAGFSIYISTTGVIKNSSLCYKDGLLLPSLNSTADCIGSGRHVFFYNARLSGINYPEGYETTSVSTELCEVIVRGCEKPGVYGRDCDVPCPTTCKDNRCHLLNGTCLSCELGFTGPYCTMKCKVGWYGEDCKLQCSDNCKFSSCNHVTGHCGVGCTSGWNGSFCLEECFQSYGENCQYPCSPHCFGLECNRFNGSCLTACTNNFYGEKCDEDIFRKLNASLDSCEEIRTRWLYGCTVSLAINFIFITGIFIHVWRVYKKKAALSCRVWKCAKSHNYTETEAPPDGSSHYQELTVTEEGKPKVYQNTVLH